MMQNWTADVNHSEVQFKVKHLAIANVAGIFNTFNCNVETKNEEFKDAKVSFELDTASINTKLGDCDNFLKSPQFFDVEKFPKITFNGTLEKDAGMYELVGELTIRDVKRTVKLEVEFNGTGQGRFGDTRAGFEVKGKINRKDYGLTWSMLTDSGSLIAGEEVKLHFDMELIKQAN